MKDHIITNNNKPIRSAIETILTLIVWCLFIYFLYSGIVDYINTHPLSEDALYRIKYYFYFSLLNVLCMALWAIYNYYRFRKNRRKTCRYVQRDELISSFGINEETYQTLQNHKKLIVYHNDEGVIQMAMSLDGNK